MAKPDPKDDDNKAHGGDTDQGQCRRCGGSGGETINGQRHDCRQCGGSGRA